MDIIGVHSSKIFRDLQKIITFKNYWHYSFFIILSNIIVIITPKLQGTETNNLLCFVMWSQWPPTEPKLRFFYTVMLLWKLSSWLTSNSKILQTTYFSKQCWEHSDLDDLGSSTICRVVLVEKVPCSISDETKLRNYFF